MTLGPCRWCGSQDRVNIFSYEELADDPIPHIVHIITELCQECKESFETVLELTGPVEHPWHEELRRLGGRDKTLRSRQGAVGGVGVYCSSPQ